MTQKERKFEKKKFTLEEFLTTLSENSPIYNEEVMNEILTSIADNIKATMKKKGFTIGTLQELSGVDASHLSRIFNHKSYIGMKVFIKIAYVLHIQPGELIPIIIDNDNKCQTNGEKFETITNQLDVASCNFLLSFCSRYVEEYRRIKLSH